jgi:hypothetical protein
VGAESNWLVKCFFEIGQGYYGGVFEYGLGGS